MLNITSKNDALQAVESNKARFEKARKNVIATNKRRDEKYLRNEVLPLLKKRLANLQLEHFWRREPEAFEFKAPLIDTDGHQLNENEIESICAEYYFQEVVIWQNNRGLVCKGGVLSDCLEEQIEVQIGFTACEINHEKKEVSIAVYISDKLKDKKTVSDFAPVVAVIDRFVEKRVNIEEITKKIGEAHKQLIGTGTVAAYKGDLYYYPLLKIDADSFSEEVKRELGMNKELRLDVVKYLKETKYFDKIKRKLNLYGYSIDIDPEHNDREEVFRTNGFTVYLIPDPEVKEWKVKNGLPSPRKLMDAHKAQVLKYNAMLKKRARDENQRLVKTVKSGEFDAYIADKLMRETLFAPLGVGSVLAETKYRVFRKEIKFHFKVGLNRKFENLSEFNRQYYKSEALGHAYLKLKDNMIDALKERYPFLSRLNPNGDQHYDFQYREGVYGRENFKIEKNTFSFSFVLEPKPAAEEEANILSFLTAWYGTVETEEWLKKSGITEDGVSQKINAYVENQNAGKIGSQKEFYLVAAEIGGDEIAQTLLSGEFYEKTKDMFDAPFEEEMFAWRGKELEKQKEGKRSLRFCNLFNFSLSANENHKKIVSELQKHGYEMSVKAVPETKERMATGRASINGDDMFEDVVSKFKLQIIIK